MESNETTEPIGSSVRPPEKVGCPQGEGPTDNLDLLDDLPLTLSIELGRSRATIEETLALGRQSLIQLGKQVGGPVDLLLNGRLFARGEVVTVDEHFGVRITQIVGRA